jgi:hypothetical protein
MAHAKKLPLQQKYIPQVEPEKLLLPLYPVDYIGIYSRHSSVGIATDMGWSLRPGRVKNFHFSILSSPALGPTQPLIQWVLGALSLGVKGPGHEADRSPTSAKVKKMWVYTSTPPYVFMA